MQQKKNRQMGLCQIGYLFPKTNLSLIVEERTFKMNKKKFGQYFSFIQNPNRPQFNSKKKTNILIFKKQNWLMYWIDIFKNDKAIIGGTYNVKI